MWTLPVWVQGRRRVLPSDQVNICIRQKSLKMQLKHVDEQIKPAISEALKKKNGLFLTHLNSEAGAANIPGKLSSMLLHHDHLCGSAMSTHTPFIVEVEGGPKYAHGCACTHTNTHTHTRTHSTWLQPTRDTWILKFFFPPHWREVVTWPYLPAPLRGLVPR